MNTLPARPTLSTGITRDQAAHLAFGHWDNLIDDIADTPRVARVKMFGEGGRVVTKEAVLIGRNSKGDVMFQVKDSGRMALFGPTFNNGTLHDLYRVDFPASATAWEARMLEAWTRRMAAIG